VTPEPYPGLDPYVPDAWKPDDSAWIDQWSQGDLVQSLPVGWVGPAGHDRVTNVDATPPDPAMGGGTKVIIDAGRSFVAGIITSQTCDVVTTGPGERHPFVQVSPVLFGVATSFPNLDALQAGRVIDRFLLDPEPSTLRALGGQLATSQEVLVADLRISLPFSKALLVGQRPLRGFRTEKAALTFAAHLAAKVSRAALSDAVIEAKEVVAQAFRAASRQDTTWWTQVDEVRVLCKPTRLDPTNVTFLVVHRTQPTPATVDRWLKVTSSARRQLKSNNITLRHTLHETVNELRAVDYRESVALDLPELYRPPDD
jgi:hypothetical protein